MRISSAGSEAWFRDRTSHLGTDLPRSLGGLRSSGLSILNSPSMTVIEEFLEVYMYLTYCLWHHRLLCVLIVKDTFAFCSMGTGSIVRDSFEASELECRGLGS